jgi:hypothetical protein
MASAPERPTQTHGQPKARRNSMPAWNLLLSPPFTLPGSERSPDRRALQARSVDWRRRAERTRDRERKRHRIR